MSDFEFDAAERLRAANPVTDATYQHADFGAMMRRITKQPRRGALTFARGFRLKMASAVGASALVTAGGIALLTGLGNSLPLLELGVAHSAQTPSNFSTARPSTTPGAATMIFRLRPMDFVAGPSLSNTASSAPIYFEAGPSDPVTALEQISAALGFGTTTPVTTNNTDGSQWEITYANGAQLYANNPNGAEIDWTYTAAPCSASSCTTGCVVTSPPSTSSAIPGPVTCLPDAPTYPSDTQSLALAQAIMSNIPTTLSFASPTVNQGDVSYTLQVGGSPTNTYDDFQFAADGSLSSASGIITTISTGDSYPVISPVAGVSTLQSQNASLGLGASSQPPLATQDSTTTTLAPTVVTLTSDVIVYEQYALADSRVAWLPTYQYSDDSGASWTVLAVDPQYVQVAATSTPTGAVPNGVA